MTENLEFENLWEDFSSFVSSGPDGFGYGSSKLPWREVGRLKRGQA